MVRMQRPTVYISPLCQFVIMISVGHGCGVDVVPNPFRTPSTSQISEAGDKPVRK